MTGTSAALERRARSSVASVDIGMSEANWAVVGKPYNAALGSAVHAQFNATYSFARALNDGRVGPGAYEQPAIGNAAVAALAAKVRVFADPGIAMDAMEPVRITHQLIDGHCMALQGDTAQGQYAGTDDRDRNSAQAARLLYLRSRSTVGCGRSRSHNGVRLGKRSGRRSGLVCRLCAGQVSLNHT